MFPDIQTVFPASVVPLPLVVAWGTTENSSFFAPSPQVFIDSDEILSELSLRAEQFQLSQTFLRRDAIVIFMALHMPMSLVLGSPELEPALQEWPYRC